MDALPMPMGDVVLIAYLFYFEAVIYLYYYVYVVSFLLIAALGSSMSAVEGHAHQESRHEFIICERFPIIHDLTFEASLQLH
jgi:hypothetical protein